MQCIAVHDSYGSGIDGFACRLPACMYALAQAPQLHPPHLTPPHHPRTLPLLQEEGPAAGALAAAAAKPAGPPTPPQCTPPHLHPPRTLLLLQEEGPAADALAAAAAREPAGAAILGAGRAGSLVVLRPSEALAIEQEERGQVGEEFGWAQYRPPAQQVRGVGQGRTSSRGSKFGWSGGVTVR